MRLSILQKNLLNIILIRSKMGAGIDQYMWKQYGAEDMTYLEGMFDELFELLPALEKYRVENWETSPHSFAKLDYAKANFHLHDFGHLFIRSVYISGSVASGCARKVDDIDLFVVSRDYCSWLSRAVVILSNFDSTMRNGGETEDHFCLNYFVEERFLSEIDLKDPFIFHEAANLKLLWGEEVIVDDGGFDLSFEAKPPQFSNYVHRLLAYIPNLIVFMLQVMVMLIKRHHPDFRRILRGYRYGFIEFFPLGFRDEKIKSFNRSLQEIYNASDIDYLPTDES